MSAANDYGVPQYASEIPSDILEQIDNHMGMMKKEQPKRNKSQKPLYICVRYWERDNSTETDILYATLREDDANSYCDNMNTNNANKPWYYEVIKMVVEV